MIQEELIKEAAAPRILAGLQAVVGCEFIERTLWIDNDFSYTRGKVFEGVVLFSALAEARGFFLLFFSAQGEVSSFLAVRVLGWPALGMVDSNLRYSFTGGKFWQRRSHGGW